MPARSAEPAMLPARSCTNPRIEHGLDDVGEKVEQHVARRNDQHAALHQQDIARRNRLHEHRADAGPLEHRLDIDGPAEHEARLDADRGTTLTSAARKAWA